MASVNITVAQYIAGTYNPADTVTILDTSANLSSLTTVQIANLVANGVEGINASNNVLQWTVAQWQAVPTLGLSFDINDLKVVFDTGAHLATLTTTDLGHLNTFGVTLLNPQDGVASFTVDQYNALGGISVDQGADVTLSDTGAHISAMTAAQIGALAIKGFDVIDASDNAYSLTADQATALNGVALTSADVITLFDTGAHIAALSADELALIGEAGVDKVDASDGVLTLTDAQLSAITNNGMALTAGDTVTLADTGALIAGHDFNTLAGQGVDVIDATDNVMSINVNQANELIAGDVLATASDVITLADTSANIQTNLTSFGELGSSGVDIIDATDNVLALTVAQTDALISGEVGLTASDVVTLTDTGANIGGLSVTQLNNYATLGIDKLDASDNAITFNAAQANVILNRPLSLTAADSVTLAATGANLAAFSATDIARLSAKGFDIFDATDNVLSLNVAQYQALGSIHLTAGDVVTLTDTGAHLASLDPSQIGALGGNGVDFLDASDNTLGLSLNQFNALGEVGLTGADTVTVSAGGSALGALSAATLGTMGEKGVDYIDAADDALSITVAQANVVALGSEIHLTQADTVTLADSGANIAAIASGDFVLLGQGGVDVIDATDNNLNLTVAQWGGVLSGNIAFTESDNVVVADTAANLDFLVAGDIGVMNQEHIDSLNATDAATYSFDAAAARVFLNGTLTIASDDNVALADTGANIAGLTAAQLGGLHAYGFDSIDATDNVLSLTAAQYTGLNGLTLTAADAVTLADTGANIAALSASVLGGLGAANVDTIDATDNVLNLTVDQWKAVFYDAEIGLTVSDTVTIVDSGANLAAMTVTDLGNLSGGVDFLDASDDAVSFTIAQLQAFQGEVGLSGDDVVTLADAPANILALTPSDIHGFAEQGVDLIHSTTGSLNVTAALANAVLTDSIAFTAGDTVVLSDTGANIANIATSAFQAMAADHIDRIDATDNILNLSVGQYLAIAGQVSLTGGDSVSLLDSGASLASLSAGQISQLAANGVDKLNASDNVLALNVAQFSALGSVTVVPGDIFSIVDTGAHLATLDFSSLAGKNVDAIDASDNQLTLSIAQFQSLGTVSLAAGDTVTLADTSANIGALSGAQLLSLGGKGIDIIDATDNVLNLSLVQFNNLGSVTLAANDVVTLSDTEGHLEGMNAGKIAALDTAGVDFIDSQSGTLNLTVAQTVALLSTSIKAVGSDAVSVVDTGANIATLSSSQIAQLAGHNIDSIDASDDALTLSVDQFSSLGTVTLTGADTVTLADAGALLTTLNFAQLAAKGVDVLDATDDVLNLSVAKFQALGEVGLTAGDTVTLLDTGANLAALTPAQIADLAGAGVDFLNASNDLLSINVAQFQALGEVGLTGGDLVTLADSGANLSAFVNAGNLDFSLHGAQGIDRIDATDNQLSLTKTAVDGLGTVALTSTDTVTMTSGEGALEALTAGQLATYAAEGIDIIDSASDVLHLSAAQTSTMINTGLRAAAGDDVTVSDTGANVIANLGALLGQLGSAGVDQIDLTDDAVTLTAAQAGALNGVGFVAGDDVTVADTGANLGSLTATQLAAMGAAGVDTLDATDDVLSLNVAQVQSITAADIGLTGADTVTLSDTGAHIAQLNQEAILALSGLGIDEVVISDHHISLNVGQFHSFLEDFSFSALDTVTVKGSNGADDIGGGIEADNIQGKGGNDLMSGGDGADTLTGGKGADLLTGGTGADHFVFTSLADSTVSASDTITDLTNVDVIDLHLIDADTTQAGDQAFELVRKFTHHAGELMVKYNAGADQTVIKMDVDGDGKADATILADGNVHHFDNFVL